jgi:hypothetical protein
MNVKKFSTIPTSHLASVTGGIGGTSRQVPTPPETGADDWLTVPKPGPIHR